MNRKIITYKDEDSNILFDKSGEIIDFGPVFQREIADFEDFFLSLENALGLAAPQVGLSKSFCAVKLKDGVNVFCNPKIVENSTEKEIMEEGCLSFPEIFIEIPRFKKITVVYQNKKGENKKIQVEGLEARILQHEIDHLNGVVFVDKK